MANYLSLEGTSDYIAAYPALIITFTSTGSITAGQAVYLETGQGFVATTTGGSPDEESAVTGSLQRTMGVAVKSVATGDYVPVCTWGVVKNITAGATITIGDNIMSCADGEWIVFKTGSGNTDKAPTGWEWNKGTALTGASSGSTFRAFLNCMN